MGMLMVASFVIAPIVGILLALRFKVFVLVPASLLAAVAVIVAGHQPKVTLALSLLGTVVLLQIGYLVGLIVRAHLQIQNPSRPANRAYRMGGRLFVCGSSVSIAAEPTTDFRVDAHIN
jgi:hypothetical protein